MAHISIVGWDSFQHYKDRCPPWIKLHRTFMTGPIWVTGTDQNRVLAIALMMLAAESGNKIPHDLTYLRRVCYLDFTPDLSFLIEVGFIELIDVAERKQDASKALADCLQVATQRRGETEKRRERRHPLTPKGEAEGSSSHRIGLTPDALSAIWNANADPSLPRCLAMTGAREKHCRARIKTYPDPDWWFDLVMRVNRSDFLCGRVEPSAGRKKPFRATFDWIINEQNLAKILEGNYDSAQIIEFGGPSFETDEDIERFLWEKTGGVGIEFPNGPPPGCVVDAH